MSNGYLKFTGNYNKLQEMGYEFQKLYASNYMQWHKDGLRIFKRGADITHGNINLYKLVKLMRGLESDNDVKQSEKCVSFYKFYSNVDANEYEYYPITTETRQQYMDNGKQWATLPEQCPNDDFPPYMVMETVMKTMLRDLEELNKLGWYQLVKHEG